MTMKIRSPTIRIDSKVWSRWLWAEGSDLQLWSGQSRSNDGVKTWTVKLFDAGRRKEFTGGTLAGVDALATKHGMTLLGR